MPLELDSALLEILVCPACGEPLRYDRSKQELVSPQAGLAYPIRDGIPILLVDEARPLSAKETGGGPLSSPLEPPLEPESTARS